MTYTSTELLTLFAAAGALIASIGSVIVSIIVALRSGNKTDAVNAIVTQARAETQEVGAKVDAVHVLANSNLSKVTTSLEVALARMEGMQEMISSLTEAKVVADKVAADLADDASTVNQTTSDIPTAVVAEEPLPVRVVATVPIPVDTEDARTPATPFTPPLPPPPDRKGDRPPPR